MHEISSIKLIGNATKVGYILSCKIERKNLYKLAYRSLYYFESMSIMDVNVDIQIS